MKFFLRLQLILLTTLFTVNFASARNLYLQIIDAQRNGVSRVTIHVEIGNESYELETDQNGNAVIENISRKKNYGHVSITSPDEEKYEDTFDYLIIKSGKKDVSEVIALRITRAYAAELFAEEVEEYHNEFEKKYPFTTLDTCSLTHENDILEEPAFPGGMPMMSRFINRFVEYPEESIMMEEQGKVYLSFTIATDGSISDIKVEKGASEHLNKEAKRLLELMPNWLPAICEHGERIQQTARLPIVFTLN